MLKNRVVPIITTTLIAIVLLSSCNSTPPTQPQNDTGIISAKAIGYVGNNAKILSGYSDESDPEGKKVVLLGEGQIKASGEFAFEFKKTIPDEKLYSPNDDSACKFTFSNPVKIGTSSPRTLAVVNINNQLLGTLYLSSTKDRSGIGKSAEYVFANQDTTIKGKCTYSTVVQNHRTN